MNRSSAHPKAPPDSDCKPQLSLLRKLEHKLKFAVVGFGVMFLGLGVMWVCIELAHLSEWQAYAIQTVVSVLTNYTLNAWWTFRDRGTPYWIGLVKFLGLKACITIPLNQAVFSLLTYYGVPYWLAWGVGVVLATGISWIGTNTYVFRDRSAPMTSAPAAVPQIKPTR